MTNHPDRRYLTPDRLIMGFDRGLRAVLGRASGTGRESPANGVAPADLDDTARRRSAALMRVNHAGEIAAQALYHGQGFTARSEELRQSLEAAAEEEGDHLEWCRQRLDELEGRTSRLDPLWYGGSWCIGAVAGLAGDRWSLGFLVETERQVIEHLDSHLAALPEDDNQSRAVLAQMRIDEGEHATRAAKAGGRALPAPLRRLMRATAKLMTRGAYWV